jgi:hypothetical protein
LSKNSDRIPFEACSSKFYSSRLLDFKNLPEPQNSEEINKKFYSSEEYSRLLQDSSLLELDFPEEKEQTFLQAQVEIIPKK